MCVSEGLVNKTRVCVFQRSRRDEYVRGDSGGEEALMFGRGILSARAMWKQTWAHEIEVAPTCRLRHKPLARHPTHAQIYKNLPVL